MKILVKDATIVDGSMQKPFRGDVLIEGDIIKEIGVVECAAADTVIEANGRVLCPGFIDTHSHSDVSILVNPYNEIKIRQGITTEVLGQDGLSMAPLPAEHIDEWRPMVSAFNGDSDDIDWKFKTTRGYLDMMAKNGVGLNQSYLVPHGNVRLEVLGLENKEASPQELEEMADVLRREMESGAFGFSSGLIYSPCVYANTEELIRLCKVVAEFDGLFVVHQRSEADFIVDSVKEIVRVGRESGARIHFSHFKVCGKDNWKHIDTVLDIIEDARAEGIRVSFDQYPYAAGSTSLGVILPPWVHEGGNEKLLKRLEDSSIRDRIIGDIERGIPGWDNFIKFAGLDQIFITSLSGGKNKGLIGKNLVELGKIRGKDPYNAAFDLIYEEKNGVGMVDFYGMEEHIIKILKRPEQNVCTDGMDSESPHPRLYWSFPRVIQKYVREQGLLSIEEAVHKMTQKPAKTFKIAKRGQLKEGYYADAVIFDLDRIEEKGDFINPKQYPQGIDYVIINGKIAVREGEYEKVKAGKVIRFNEGLD